MGGGGAMRTAAKIAGVGVSRSVLRPSALPTEQPIRNAASRQASVAGVSSQGSKSAEVAAPHAAAPWDDWDFADDGELDVPRVVFGSVPTFEEAKEATAELKDAIDQVYLYHESSQGSSPGGEVSVLSPTRFEPVNRSSVIGAISNPSVPTHAIQAFHLLSSSREAQAVVASLACDPNVWNAVMENPAVTSFFQSQQTVADFGVEETNEEMEKLSSCASVVAETPNDIEVTTESHPGKPFFNFMDLLQNVKLTVTELVRRVSSYLQNIFPTVDVPKEKPSSDADGNAKASFMDNINIMGGSFIGLAVLVIMVIVTKRA